MPDNRVFQGNPVNINISRSKFDLTHKHTTTFSAGKLIPLFSYSDVLPGDSFKVPMSEVLRSITPVCPVMDDAFLDVYAFFVPHKLVLSRRYMSPDVSDQNYSFAAVMDAQDSLLNMPLPTHNAVIPSMGAWPTWDGTASGCATALAAYTGSLADYFGYPFYDKPHVAPITGDIASYNVNCLDVLAYYSIWNEYFREPNTQSPVTYTVAARGAGSDYAAAGTPELTVVGTSAGIPAGGVHTVAELPPAPVSVFHGYFGSALPWPQRNSTAVQLPIDGVFKLVTNGTNTYDIKNYTTGSTDSIILGNTSGYIGTSNRNLYITGNGNNAGTLKIDNGATYTPGSSPLVVNRTNLLANVAGANVSINELRMLFATQRYYEKLARGGNRLEDLSMALFNVRGSDVASNIPEYLGGVRIPLRQAQVTSTADTGSSGAPIGALGAVGHNADSNYLFTKSFTDWGTIQIVCCVRVNQSFYQGINKRHRRFKALDFYNPTFANIGEVPVYKEEIYVRPDGANTDLSDLDNTVTAGSNREPFGYQEAWAEYRYLPDRVSGHMRPNSDLGYYTYCNDFSSVPSLAGYLDAAHDATAIDRTLTVGSSAAGFQFYGQFYFPIQAYRPLPFYSIPGLIDHN